MVKQQWTAKGPFNKVAQVAVPLCDITEGWYHLKAASRRGGGWIFSAAGVFTNRAEALSVELSECTISTTTLINNSDWTSWKMFQREKEIESDQDACWFLFLQLHSHAINVMTLIMNWTASIRDPAFISTSRPSPGFCLCVFFFLSEWSIARSSCPASWLTRF